MPVYNLDWGPYMIEGLLLTLICALSFVLKIPYFNLPLDRDYGAHGYIAYCWLHKKGLMYRDIYESKTPGLKLIYMVIIRWLGISRKSFRLFFALYNLLTTMSIYALASLLFSPAVGLVAALLFALYSSVPSLWWHFSNIESYHLLPTVLSFLLFSYGEFSLTSVVYLCMVLSGFLGGVAFMFKQTALINTVAPILLYMLGNATSDLFPTMGSYCAGLSLPIIAFFVYFMVIHKTPWSKLPFSASSLSLLRSYLKTPLFKVTRAAVESNRRRFRTIFYDLIFLIATASGSTLILLTSGNTPGLVLVPWAALSFLSAILSRTYLAYHFIPAVAPLCILAAFSLEGLFASLIDKGIFSLSPGDLGAIGIVTVLFLVFLYQLIKDLRLPSDLMGVFYSGEDAMYAVCEEVGKYIKKTTKETDYVYSWGHEPDIYLWSERRAAVYCIYPPITNPTIFSKEHIAEELAQLNKNKPIYFIMTSDFGQFKEFEQFLIAHYTLLQKFEPYLYLFKIRPEAIQHPVTV
jgi:hypothetical protein